LQAKQWRHHRARPVLVMVVVLAMVVVVVVP
jgi:hypothetical protein